MSYIDRTHTLPDKITRATKHAMRAARRPRKPQLLQFAAQFPGGVPPLKTGPKFTLASPYLGLAIGWSKAAAIGRAYGRIVSGEDAYPSAAEVAKIKAAQEKGIVARKAAAEFRKKHGKAKKYRRDPRGEWWMSRFADSVERKRAAANPEPVKPTGVLEVEPTTETL